MQREEELEDVLGVLSIREYFDYIQGLTSRQDKADSLGVLIERAGADWCCMVGIVSMTGGGKGQ